MRMANDAVIKFAPPIYCRIKALTSNILDKTLSTSDVGVLGGTISGAVSGAAVAVTRTKSRAAGVAGAISGGAVGLVAAAAAETVAGPVTATVAGAVVGSMVGVPLEILYNNRDQARAIIRRGFVRALDAYVVGNIVDGSLTVEVHCYTPENFLEFLDDFNKGIIKKNLTEEFSKVGLQLDNLAVEIDNLDDIKEHEIYLR